MSVTSKTQICKIALTFISGGFISSIDDENDPTAIYCKTYFDTCARLVLSGCLWDCAKKRAVLTRSTEAPLDISLSSNDGGYSDNGFAYKFALPSDHVRTYAINNEIGRHVTADEYDEESGYILSNQQQVGMIYSYYDGDVSKWDASLAELVALKLAQKLCYTTIGDTSDINRIEDMYKRAESNASLQSAQQAARFSDSNQIRKPRHQDFKSASFRGLL